jgi:hypothetical protein
MQEGLKMDTVRNTNWLSQRLLQSWRSFRVFFDKVVHHKRFVVILAAILVFGLILAFIFAEAPIAGENYPIPGYP